MTNTEASRIISWCEKQHEIEERTAKKQIRIVLFTVIAGIILILAMPRLIFEIEYLWRIDSLPKRIIEKAHTTQEYLEAHHDEIDNQAKNAKTRLNKIEKDLVETKNDLNEHEQKLNTALYRDLTVFRYIQDTTPNNLRTMIETIQAQDGSFISAGFEKGTDDTEILLLLRSADGNLWTPISFGENIKEQHGRLNSLLQAEDRTFVAAGFETEVNDTNTLLLLRSSDGISWKPVRPKEYGEKLKGRLLTIMQAQDSTFIGVGFESGTDDTETLLILRSSDGESWTPIRPKEHGEGIRGHLQTIVQSKNNSFIAAGFERTTDNIDIILLLHSADGESWRSIRPDEHNSKLTGRLQSIMQTHDGEYIAVGYEGTGSFKDTMLLLRSTDGLSWRTVRLEKNGKKLRGRIHSVFQTNDGRYIAVGEDIWQLSPMTEIGTFGKPAATTSQKLLNEKLREIQNKGSNVWWSFGTIGEFGSYNVYSASLLHSADGMSWTPVRLHKDGLRLTSNFNSLILPRGDSLFGIRSSRSWLNSLHQKEAENIKSQIIQRLEVPPDVVVSSYIWPQLDKIREYRMKVESLNDNFKQQGDFFDTVQVSSTNQLQATKTFSDVITELDQALRQAEPLREGGQIATRIAIVGLLIYLIQILVNRYRYHLRLSKFYKARAQALRLISDNSSDNSAFSIASLSDLSSALSPDSLQFDKLSNQSPVYSK